MTKKEKFNNLIQNIEKARIKTDEYNIINIVAVSKYVQSNEVEEYFNLGQRAFGENRVQMLKQKQEELNHLPLSWHFIGRLQKNKINQLIDLNPVLTHSCDSLSLALEIDKRLKAKNKTMNILLQINSANESSKAGVSKDQANETYLQIKEECSNINLKGVMSFGAHQEDKGKITKSFEDTFGIFESLKPHGAKYCSMGMSNDYELAIECGSNMIRVGSTLFKT